MTSQRVRVSPEAIAAHLGVQEIRQMPMTEDGRLIWIDNRPVIELNSRRTELRQRFTLAHEIAHLMLSEPGRQSFRRSLHRTSPVSAAERQDEEELCDSFAAALLLPRAWISTAAQRWRKPLDLNFFRMVRAQAGVSIAAAAARVTDVSAATCAVVRWTKAPSGWVCSSKSAVPPALSGRIRSTSSSRAVMDRVSAGRSEWHEFELRFDDFVVAVRAQIDIDRTGGGCMMLITEFDLDGAASDRPGRRAG